MLSISILVKIKSKSKCHLKFKFAFILSFKLYTDGACIEKKLYSTLGTDCKSFYIAIEHDNFLSLKKSRGFKKRYLDAYLTLPNLVNITNFQGDSEFFRKKKIFFSCSESCVAVSISGFNQHSELSIETYHSRRPMHALASATNLTTIIQQLQSQFPI